MRGVTRIGRALLAYMVAAIFVTAAFVVVGAALMGFWRHPLEVIVVALWLFAVRVTAQGLLDGWKWRK